MPPTTEHLQLTPEQMAQVRQVLRQYWGFETLRPLQDQAIAAALAHRDSVVVMPTGGGKSLCYQLPPALENTVDVVVSPLIALMKDQVDALREAGYPAVAFHSAMSASEARDVRDAMRDGKIRLVFVAPERLLTESFMEIMRGLNVRRFAIDEAHCISQWGHDFRPEYRRMAMLREHFPDASVHAFTATATPQVRDDIATQLNLRDPAVLVGRFDRHNLVYRILPQMDVDRQVLEVVQRHKDQAVIAYAISRKDTESLAEWLKSRGVKAACYHAGLTPEERHRTQDLFANEKLDVVVATVAFGMGIDRSNVRCVIHTAMPKTVEHYQQETGRAGRDGLEAECVLFYSAGDAMKWKMILQKSAANSPDPEQAERVQLGLLREMERFCNSSRCRHKFLSEYFGQAYETENCGACDVCLEEVDVIPESTLIAQKILSCVARVKEHFGVKHVVEVLRGAQTENVRKFGHETLSTHGLLKEISAKSLTAMIYQLVDQEVLVRTATEFPMLALNEQSWQVLRNQLPVRLLRPKERVKEQTNQGELDWAGVDRGLFDALKAWRRELAASRNLPPYTIFHDSTLMDLARIRPTSVPAIQDVQGIGSYKAGMYGVAVTQLIAGYCTEHQLAADPMPVRASRKLVQKNGVRELAFDLFDDGKSIDEVCASTERARSTVLQYLEQYLLERGGGNLDVWVEPAMCARVIAAWQKLGEGPLKPLHEELGGQVPYEVIRLVLTHQRMQNH